MTDQLSLQLGLQTIESYKRLSYTPWHALAEFVDNSTQSFANNRAQVEAALASEQEPFRVNIVYDRNEGRIRVSDNATGMSREELEYALHVGARPSIQSGRSKFGMGLKTAACWLGNTWSVRTKKLGETTEYEVVVDVPRIAAGDNALPTEERPDQPPQTHYTILEIWDLNRPLQGRTIGKIKEFLRSMYRIDLSEGILDLRWQHEKLDWEFPDSEFASDREGNLYRKDFAFDVGEKHVTGWVGVLDRGSRAKAGFSILHAERVVKGWPESWRPESIYGQFEGRNDLINQRLVGEIRLDDFEVTQAKDDILWFGDEQDAVEKALKEQTSDYISVARERRRGDEAAEGPSELEVQTAVDELQEELSSSEMADLVSLEDLPAPEAVEASIRPLLEQAATATPDFSVEIGPDRLVVHGYMEHDMSINDPYVVSESTSPERVIVVINLNHPHFKQLEGSEGVLNFLRHCVYDSLAEWKARQQTAKPDPDTMKLIKDRFLRLRMTIEMHRPE
jgi:hypothetical protein